MDIGRTLPADVTADLLDELVASKARFDALLGVAADGIAHIDAGGTIARWNVAAEAISGIAAERALGSPVDAIVPGGWASIRAVPLDGLPHLVRWSFGAAGRAPVRAQVVAIVRTGGIDGWLVSFAPQQRFDEIEQLKNELIGSISHELKTPLATIKAYVETLRDNRLTAETAREYLAVMGDQADRLARAIDDLLLVSRVEAGQLLKRRETVSLDAVLDAALASIAFDADAHPLQRETAGVMISGDPDLLRDALAQVIENAAKFSAAGQTIEVRGESREGRCLVAVADRGIGIADDHLPYIFDRFYRVDRALAATSDGSGLGLFIASALARAHGGTIDVRSEPGLGSTFTLSLPVRS
jgi:signal transduction histidine kinase